MLEIDHIDLHYGAAIALRQVSLRAQAGEAGAAGAVDVEEGAADENLAVGLHRDRVDQAVQGGGEGGGPRHRHRPGAARGGRRDDLRGPRAAAPVAHVPPGLAGDGLDFHDGVGDLGDLLLEEVIEQALVGKSSKPVRKGEHPSLICNSIGTSPEFSTHVSTLRSLGVRHVVICGFPFNSAVAMTAIEHVNQQFEHVYIVTDATRSDAGTSRDPEKMKQALGLLGVELVSLSDFV